MFKRKALISDSVFRRKQDLQSSESLRSDLRKPEPDPSLPFSKARLRPTLHSFHRTLLVHLMVLLVQEFIPLLSPGTFLVKQRLVILDRTEAAPHPMTTLLIRSAEPTHPAGSALSGTPTCTGRDYPPLQSRSLASSADFWHPL